MSVSRAKAAAGYKKQDGEIMLTADGKAIEWASNNPGSVAAVSLATGNLTNLQQTPPSSAKAVLKLFVQAPGASAPETYQFTFSSPSNAREELNAFIEPLKRIMEAARAATVSSLVSATPAGAPSKEGNSGPSASMAFAQAVSASSKPSTSDAYSDAQLLSNTAFQKAVTDQNPTLKERFAQAMRDKPESMTPVQLSKQFWTSRIHLLRAYAAEQAQTRGEYNVIADIKPERQKDGEMRYNFTPAKFRLIWQQYPFLLKIHNELFKKKAFTREEDFWGEWVTSRLYKKMKGEKITEQDYEHPHFDRYLDLVDNDPRPKHFQVDGVPRFIDLTGNEQNHSQKKGNAPDFTMKPAFNGRNAILNTLNNMSERLLMNVTPSDAEHGPAGVDEETFNELLLRDLQRNDKDNRIVLDISDQRHLAPNDTTNGTTRLTAAEIQQAIAKLRRTIHDEPALSASLSDSDDEPAATATSSMFKSIRLRASHTTPDQAAQNLVSQKTKDAAVMAHSTTLDFLHYFWLAFLSGDASRAEDVRFLADTLRNAGVRFEAVAAQAETERHAVLEQLRQLEAGAPPGKRRRLDRSRVPGGSKAVERMLAAVVEALAFADARYRTALGEQTLTAGAADVS